MHIHNPVNGEKRGYGFVDFVDEQSTKKALGEDKNYSIIFTEGWLELLSIVTLNFPPNNHQYLNNTLLAFD